MYDREGKPYDQSGDYLLSGIIFDTSAINGLENAGAASDPIMRGLTSGFDVILTASSAEEILATKSPERRAALLSRLGWLLSSATCIWQAQEVVRLLISAHKNAPHGFDWRNVGVRARVYENAIARRDFDDAFRAELRSHQFDLEKGFKRTWSSVRPGFDQILANDPSERPKGMCINKRFTRARRCGMVELWPVLFVEHRVFSSVTRDYRLS